jgi:DNA-binding NarL/FixJ family response regulator
VLAKGDPSFWFLFESLSLLSHGEWTLYYETPHKQEKPTEVMDHVVKVLLANGPEVLRTGLATLLQQQSDIEVVGTVLDPIELLVAVGDTQADVVVLTLPDSGEMPGICSHLLHEYPQLLILALSSARTRACVYRQAITVELLGDISDEGILTAVRRVKAARHYGVKGEEAS